MPLTNLYLICKIDEENATMVDLTTEIRQLKQNKQLTNTINKTLDSFKQYKKTGSNEDLFSELCYCILTANCQAQTCFNIQQAFPHDFSQANEKQIKKHLLKYHYRFPNIRTRYILNAQMHCNDLHTILNTYQGLSLRTWFVSNIKGLGMKEGSHFLRNIGYDEYAIIDTHILSLLQNYRIVSKPKTMTKKTYLTIEQQLKILAQNTSLKLSSLDLYLWYMQTGMVLK